MTQKRFTYDELTNGAITFRELKAKISEAADNNINSNTLKEYLTEKDLMATIKNKFNNLSVLGITPNGYEHGLRLSVDSGVHQDGTPFAYPTTTFPEKITTEILKDANVLAERTEKHITEISIKNAQKRRERQNRNAGKPWTKNEMESVIRLLKAGKNNAQIANIICRPYNEIDQLVPTLNITEE